VYGRKTIQLMSYKGLLWIEIYQRMHLAQGYLPRLCFKNPSFPSSWFALNQNEHGTIVDKQKEKKGEVQ
jgi:hypothetical protein